MSNRGDDSWGLIFVGSILGLGLSKLIFPPAGIVFLVLLFLWLIRLIISMLGILFDSSLSAPKARVSESAAPVASQRASRDRPHSRAARQAVRRAEREAKANSVAASFAAGDWRSAWMHKCDSPAETTFLDRMIRHFNLSAINQHCDALYGGGVKLEAQKQIGTFRVDFLLNDALVVEIDGEEFHSSPSQRSTDAHRDRCLGEDAYRILRIPAKRAFQEDDRVMEEVKLKIDELYVNPPRRPPSQFPEFARDPVRQPWNRESLDSYLDDDDIPF